MPRFRLVPFSWPRRYASGIVVLPDKTATVCEFEPATETCRVEQGGSDHGFDTKSTEARYETMIDLDGEILM